MNKYIFEYKPFSTKRSYFILSSLHLILYKSFAVTMQYTIVLAFAYNLTHLEISFMERHL